MKTKSILLSLCLVTGLAQAQTTHIVDNNPNGIGDFTTLSSAISAATSGDIILVVPSATSYGDLSMTSTGKKLTIAGGGANGATGLVTKLGAISLNGGSVNNTNLDGFVLGGFECKSIDINFVDSVKIKAVKTTEVISTTNYHLRVRNSVGAEVEYVEAGNMAVGGCTGIKLFHLYLKELSNTAVLDISTTTNFIVSNSFLLSNVNTRVSNVNYLTLDDTSVGLFNNNIFRLVTGYNRPTYFGGAVTLTNNIFAYVYDYPYNSTAISGAQSYQNNTFFHEQGIGYLTYPTNLVTLDGGGANDANNNNYLNPQFVDVANFNFALNDASGAKDSGSGLDIDGTTADRGIFGGLDPMPTVLPSRAVGISVVPSVTNLRLSLPTAVTGGKVILNVTGQSKKN